MPSARVFTCLPRTSPALRLRISAKQRWCGTGAPASPSATLSCGNVGVHQPLLTRSAAILLLRTPSKCARGSFPTPIFQREKFAGFWIQFRRRAPLLNRGIWRLAPSIRGFCGTSRTARITLPTPRMHAARCFSTSPSSVGTAPCCSCSIFRALCCQMWCPRREKFALLPAIVPPVARACTLAWATNKQPFLGNAVSRSSKQKQPTARAVFFLCTQGTRRISPVQAFLQPLRRCPLARMSRSMCWKAARLWAVRLSPGFMMRLAL